MVLILFMMGLFRKANTWKWCVRRTSQAEWNKSSRGGRLVVIRNGGQHASNRKSYNKRQRRNS